MNTDQLVALGKYLQESGYRFVTPTPATHARVNARPNNCHSRSLRDVFGWNRPVTPQMIATLMPSELRDRLSEVFERHNNLLRSRVRFSTLGNLVLAHSAYPTTASDAVFFGPDTYRFVNLIARSLRDRGSTPRTVLDIGCGSGAGGIFVASLLAQPPFLILTDINQSALQLAAVNAELAGINAGWLAADLLLPLAYGAQFDLIIANPPYLADPAHRVYRDGGKQLGAELAVRIVRESIKHIAPGGCLILYTGVAIVDGDDAFQTEVANILTETDCDYEYHELDVDVFGEELDSNATYHCVDRIALVSLLVTRGCHAAN